MTPSDVVGSPECVRARVLLRRFVAADARGASYDLTLDDDGLVIDYPGLARRLHPSGAGR